MNLKERIEETEGWNFIDAELGKDKANQFTTNILKAVEEELAKIVSKLWVKGACRELAKDEKALQELAKSYLDIEDTKERIE